MGYKAYVLVIILVFLVGCSAKGTNDLNGLTGRNGEKKVITYFLSAENSLLPLENSKPRIGIISHVVLHFISNVKHNPAEPYNLEDIKTIFIENGFSAHYLIGREGQVYRLVPEERIAFHAGPGFLSEFSAYENRLNDYSIGIELMAIGTRDEMLPILRSQTYELVDPSLIGYTDAQYESLNTLLNDLHKRNPDIRRSRKHVVGHDEYAPVRKTDPGSLFDWSRIGY
ncbi:N-acetylmuramoyl-L-alanine amidase [Bacillus sp. DJP31]|uniref:N-acetylmuramoyl-L-alanine amidase n=1 Tax=Bacillus sp. DJP31 TaxID=3409789 RepID=UPI003BB5989F